MEQHIKPAFESGTPGLTVQPTLAEHREWLVDQALMDTFPASDPVSHGHID